MNLQPPSIEPTDTVVTHGLRLFAFVLATGSASSLSRDELQRAEYASVLAVSGQYPLPATYDRLSAARMLILRQQARLPDWAGLLKHWGVEDEPVEAAAEPFALESDAERAVRMLQGALMLIMGQGPTPGGTRVPVHPAPSKGPQGDTIAF